MKHLPMQWTLPVVATAMLLACGGDDGMVADSQDPTGTAGPESGSTGSAQTDPQSTESASTAPAASTGDDPTTAGSDPTMSGTSGDVESTGGTEQADCTDQLILDLALNEGSVSAGAVGNTADGMDWVSTVDATAGGFGNDAMNPWVYMRFTADGIAKVDIDDIAALTSTDWHIAAKRTGIRLNSGTSGPSTVAAAPVDAVYAAITEVPAGIVVSEENFYSATCELRSDGMGLGAPGYRLTPWWQYNNCIVTTGQPFILELPDGTTLKFVVEAYYAGGQEGCNVDGETGSGAANYTWRWSFLR